MCTGRKLRSIVNVMLWLRLQSLSRSVLSTLNYEEGFLKNVMSCDFEPGVAPQPVFLCLQLSYERVYSGSVEQSRRQKRGMSG